MAGDLMQDLRFGLRSLWKRPGFSLMAVAILGLGIGAPATVLSLVDRIFFEAPPGVDEPHRLIRVYRAWAPGQGGGSLGNADFRYYREHVSTLDGLAAWGGGMVAAYSAAGATDQLVLGFASDDYFDVLGVSPALGRDFLPEEDATPGSHPVLVLSHGLWQRAFGGDPDVVGRDLTLNGTSFQVVGVAPEGFQGVSPVEPAPDAWAPIAMYGTLSRAGHTAWWEWLPNQRSNWLQVVGRLAPGATFDAAEANLLALSETVEQEGRPDEETLLLARQVLYSPAREATLARLSAMLFAVVGIVLVVAAANVAVLLLARATSRGREMGIRTALGAGRGRLVRQLLAESLVLGAGAALVGMGLAWSGADLAGALLPFRFAGSFRPDPGVLALVAGLGLLTAAAVGLAPALHVARREVSDALGDGRSTGGRSRVRDTLVVAQVALSLVLVAGAVLFGRSFQAARSEPVGFSTERLLLVETDLQSLGFDRDQGLAFVRSGSERLAALPGVETVATSRQIPFQGDWSTDFEPDPALFPDAPAEPVFIGLNAVSGGYFEALEVPLVRGRGIGTEDPDGPPVAVVNETLAETLWPGQNPLGRSLPLSEERSLEVVGVARDAQYYELGEEPVAQLYVSTFQVYQARTTFVLRTAGDPLELAGPAREVLRALEPTLAFERVTTMDAVFDDVVARYRVSAALVTVFGALTLLLAAVGLYGVVSYLVAERTREIGVRMALGADRGRVAGTVLKTGLGLAAVGVGVGLVGALVARGFTASLLYDVPATDPVALVAACLVLLTVAGLASVLPARRATRVDPREAMAGE